MNVHAGRRNGMGVAAHGVPEWLARLAHDVRGPIGPIQLAARMLEGPTLPAGQVTELGKSIERQANRLSQLANDLDDILRIGLGEFQMQLVACDLHAIALRAVGDAEHSAASLGRDFRGIAVRPPSEAVIVLADPVRLAQLIAQMMACVAPGAPEGAECWVDCDRTEAGAMLRLHDGARRIYRSAGLAYLIGGELPIDPGVLAMAPLIGRQIALAHGAVVGTADEVDGRIGGLVLEMPAVEVAA